MHKCVTCLIYIIFLFLTVQAGNALAAFEEFDSTAFSDWDFAKIQKAAERGDVKAQFMLALEYGESAIRRRVPRDDAKSLQWFQKAADQGYAIAQEQLGSMYEYGYLVPKDEAKAVQWYQKAAEQGHPSAQFRLGKMYAEGRGGIPKNEQKAAQLYQKLIDSGWWQEHFAQLALGEMYYYGRGVPQDDFKAARLFKMVPEKNIALVPAVLGFLGKMHIDGRGVIRDRRKGCSMLREAADFWGVEKAIVWYNQECAR